MKRGLILGGGLSGLGVARSLRCAGISSTIVCQRRDLASYSRGIAKVIELSDPPNQLANLLREVDDQHYVFPCNDDFTNRLCQLASATNFAARMLVPKEETARIFTEKDRFAKILDKLNIPHPQTFPIDSAESIPYSANLAGDRFFIKPVDSQTFFRLFKRKAIPLNEKDAAGAIASALERGLKLLAQEYIPGGAEKTLFIDGCCDSRGQIAGAFARQRLRIYPPRFGNSTLMKSIALSPLQSQLSQLEQLFTSTQYSGLFSSEWKLDESGFYRLLEINIRAWWYVEFPTRCGINLPLLLIRLIDGESSAPPLDKLLAAASAGYKTGEFLFHPYYDLHALRDTSARPIVTWLSQFFRKPNSHFVWSDPAPGAMSTWNWLMRRGRTHG